MTALGDPFRAWKQTREPRQKRGKRDRRQNESCPDFRDLKRQGPRVNEGKQCGGRQQRAPEIVDHFPTADPIQRVSLSAARIAAIAEYPRQQLPIAAHPAVQPRRRDIVTRRKFFDDFDIGNQAGARKASFEKVVTQYGTVGYPSVERGFEGVDVIDAFAAIGALLEKILINVRNSESIRVKPARSRENALKQRTFATHGHGGSHTRLKYGVAFHDATETRIQPRPV